MNILSLGNYQHSHIKTSHEREPWPLSAENYKLDGPIGHGRFGIVWRAHCFKPKSEHHEKKVAIKMIDLDGYSDIEDVRKEITIMSNNFHKNVLNYYCSFVYEKELWLVMPLLDGGSIDSVARIKFGNRGIKDEGLLASILSQVVEGLSYFHSLGQIHRDIKAQNILVHKSGQVFLSDFSISDYIKAGQKKDQFVGSPCWMSPEIILQEDGYDAQVDMWALGITAIELAEGKVPHQDNDARTVVKKIIECPAPCLSMYFEWSDEFRAFVDDCLIKDPKRRLKSQDAFKKHQAFFRKTQGRTFIRENLLKDIPPLKERIPKDIIELGNNYFDEKYRKQAQLRGFGADNTPKKRKKESQRVVWNFSEDMTNYERVQTKPSSRDFSHQNEFSRSRSRERMPQVNYGAKSHQPVCEGLNNIVEEGEESKTQNISRSDDSSMNQEVLAKGKTIPQQESKLNQSQLNPPHEQLHPRGSEDPVNMTISHPHESSGKHPSSKAEQRPALNNSIKYGKHNLRPHQDAKYLAPHSPASMHVPEADKSQKSQNSLGSSRHNKYFQPSPTLKPSLNNTQQINNTPFNPTGNSGNPSLRQSQKNGGHFPAARKFASSNNLISQSASTVKESERSHSKKVGLSQLNAGAKPVAGQLLGRSRTPIGKPPAPNGFRSGLQYLLGQQKQGSRSPMAGAQALKGQQPLLTQPAYQPVSTQPTVPTQPSQPTQISLLPGQLAQNQYLELPQDSRHKQSFGLGQFALRQDAQGSERPLPYVERVIGLQHNESMQSGMPMGTEPHQQLMLNQSLQSFDQRGEPHSKHLISDRFSMNFSIQDSQPKGLQGPPIDRTQTMAVPGRVPLNPEADPRPQLSQKNDYASSARQGRSNVTPGQHRASTGVQLQNQITQQLSRASPLQGTPSHHQAKAGAQQLLHGQVMMKKEAEDEEVLEFD